MTDSLAENSQSYWETKLAEVNKRLSDPDLADTERPQLECDAQRFDVELRRCAKYQTRIAPTGDLKDIQDVVISEGVGKYVLILATGGDGGSRWLVRGNREAEYHYQCATETLAMLEKCGASGEVKGGGRIRLDKAEQVVEIFGYSYQYGPADHSITASLCRETFGSNYTVTFGDYGY